MRSFIPETATRVRGQGELCGVALEITSKVTLVFDVIKGQTIEWPRIESEDRIMVVGSARPMEDAARIANTELILWLEEEHGYDRLDAYQLLTQAGGPLRREHGRHHLLTGRLHREEVPHTLGRIARPGVLV